MIDVQEMLRQAADARAEIARLQEAKRAALKVADERSAQNVKLRQALKNLFLLACVSQDIRADAPQMKVAGELLAAEQTLPPKEG